MTKVLIVGGGIAGISSAIQLKMKGFDVTIYEKKLCLGGRNSAMKVDGYTFELGPTFICLLYTSDAADE